MKYELSHFEKLPKEKHSGYLDDTDSWLNVMPNHDDKIVIDDDCPEYDPAYATEPVHRFNGRIIAPRKSPLDQTHVRLPPERQTVVRLLARSRRGTT